MKPKNLAIGVAILAILAIALKFLNNPGDNNGGSSDKHQLKGRALLTEEKEKLLESAHTVVIEAEKTLYLNDDDKNRSDLGNFTLTEDAKKDDEIIAKSGSVLNNATVAKLREKEVSSVEVRENVILTQGAASWLVKSFHGLPGKDPFDSNNGFLKDIRSAKIVRTAGKVAAVAKKHETGKTTITFKDKGGTTLWVFNPGRRHDAGGRFAAVQGEEYAYHVQSENNSDNDNFSWLNIDNDNDDWAENNILQHLEEDGIEKLEITYPTLPPVVEAITFTNKDGTWSTETKIKGKDFDNSKIKDLIDDLTDLRWSNALALDADDVKGATGKYRKLVLHTKSLGRYQVQVGRKPAPPKPEKKKEEPKTDEEKKKEDDPQKEDESDKEDEPEPGPVITLVESLEVSSPLFQLADKTAFDAGESLYDAIPESITGFFKDPPPPPPPPPASLSGTGGVSATGGVKKPPRKKITVATPPIPVPPIPKKQEDKSPAPPLPPSPPPSVKPPTPPPTAPPPPPPTEKK